MGAYNDYRHTSREGRKYVYAGRELLPYAERKLEKVTAAEAEARRKMAARLTNPNVKANSTINETLRGQISNFGSQREQCLVWVHEFKRGPDKEFELSLGD